MSEDKKMTNMELIQNIQANTVAKKESGLGYMWKNTTGSIGKSFAVVGNFATAAEVFSVQAVEQATQSRIESAQELCESMGIEAQGFEAVSVAKAITAYMVSQS